MDKVKLRATEFVKTKLGTAIVIVCICMIIWVISSWNVHGNDYENFVNGFWVADDAFCDESEIDSMLLFIGKYDKLSGSRPAHMIIADDIMNQKIEIKHKKISSGMSKKLNKFKVDADIQFEEECQIPSDVTLEFDVLNGSLKIHKDGNMYAIMHKDHEISESFN